ncbi:TetR/AcrR family transcriptional regulator [Nonomuraea antimicrobica]
MPVPKGATLDPAQTRATILDTATRLLYERGLDGIGVAELCAAVGASKETLYRHFGSKDGLVLAVLEARSDRVVRWLRDAADAAGRTRPRNSPPSSTRSAAGTPSPASVAARSSTRPCSGTRALPGTWPPATSPGTSNC